MKLAQALADQVGQEVVYSEIAQLIRLLAKTVEHYINVLNTGK